MGAPGRHPGAITGSPRHDLRGPDRRSAPAATAAPPLAEQGRARPAAPPAARAELSRLCPDLPAPGGISVRRAGAGAFRLQLRGARQRARAHSGARARGHRRQPPHRIARRPGPAQPGGRHPRRREDRGQRPAGGAGAAPAPAAAGDGAGRAQRRGAAQGHPGASARRRGGHHLSGRRGVAPAARRRARRALEQRFSAAGGANAVAHRAGAHRRAQFGAVLRRVAVLQAAGHAAAGAGDVRPAPQEHRAAHRPPHPARQPRRHALAGRRQGQAVLQAPVPRGAGPPGPAAHRDRRCPSGRSQRAGPGRGRVRAVGANARRQAHPPVSRRPGFARAARGRAFARAGLSRRGRRQRPAARSGPLRPALRPPDPVGAA